MECRTSAGIWGPGPVCQETGVEMAFYFGVDSFQYCGWHIASNAVYDHLTSLIKREENWNCRIAMIPQKAFAQQHNYYLPFSIPVWGVVEKDHIHIDNHLNFIFHAANGLIVGVAAYPVRDRLQFGKEGTVITIHGPVKWFSGHSFLPFTSGRLSSPGTGLALGELTVWCALTSAVTFGLYSIVYRFYLRKRLVQKMLKKD